MLIKLNSLGGGGQLYLKINLLIQQLFIKCLYRAANQPDEVHAPVGLIFKRVHN